MKEKFIIALGTIGSYFAVNREMMGVLVALVVIDYITGIISAIITKKLNSAVGYIGILRKVTIFVVVVIATMCDIVLGNQKTMLIQNATIVFYAFIELTSIVENLGKSGVQIPSTITGVLEVLANKEKTLTRGTTNAQNNETDKNKGSEAQ